MVASAYISSCSRNSADATIKVASKAAHLKLIELEEQGLIDIVKDPIEKRLDFLIDLWADKCPATVAILAWQREIVAKFYGGG